MFRRSGSFTSFHVDGSLPAVTDAAFAQALKKHRFRTIEGAASEETSAGWVTPEDPTGETFETRAIAFDEALWLRLRIDRKKLPARWLQIYRAEAERSRGRKLSQRERSELRADLQEKLLPRVLPAVRFVDALLFVRTKRLLLFATSGPAKESFVGALESTFDVRLRADGPLGRAERAELEREQKAYLREVSPIEWESQGSTNGSRPARAERVREEGA